jgi:hypothetical protein
MSAYGETSNMTGKPDFLPDLSGIEAALADLRSIWGPDDAWRMPEPSPRRSRHRHPRPQPHGGLLTERQAAAWLGASIKTIRAFVKSGALRYIALGHGRQRQRRMFTLAAFIEHQARRDAPPCPSIGRKARRSTITTSKSTVLDFAALRDAATAGKPKA